MYHVTWLLCGNSKQEFMSRVLKLYYLTFVRYLLQCRDNSVCNSIIVTSYIKPHNIVPGNFMIFQK